MDLAARVFCLFLQTCVTYIILIYPYAKQFRYSVSVTFAAASILILCYISPYFLFGVEPYRLGYWRIALSCLAILLQSIAISHLIQLRLTVLLFSFFVIKNLTGSLIMGAQLFYFFFLPQSLAADTVISLLYSLVFALLTPFIIIYIKKQVDANPGYSSLNVWRILWSVPFCYYIFFCIYGDPHHLSGASIGSVQTIIMPFVWFFGTMISQYGIIKMMSEASQASKLKEQLKYTKLLSEAQHREYTSLQDNITQTAKLRHDMRHHFVALDGYLDIPDINAAKSYLAVLVRDLNSHQTVSYCPNYAVNSLLNYYSEKANENQVRVNLSVHLSETLPIALTDFCSILGNLFDNALEACDRQNMPNPFISLSIGYVGTRMLVLSIRNSYSGEIHVADGNFLSSKRDEAGTGTASIKYMVNKYDGVCRFSYKNNIFEVSILLNPHAPVTEV